METAAVILIAEAMALYFLVLFAHSLRHRFGTSFFFALIGGLTAVMSWVTDSGLSISIGNITFVVGSTVFYTSLLLGVFVVYVFDGPRQARIAISTVLCVSIFVPLVAAILHMQMRPSEFVQSIPIPEPDFRINLASVVTTLVDLIFLAMAWEFLGKPNLRLRLWFRSYITLLGVMWLDVVLFATGAFAGTPFYINIMQGTLVSRFVVSLLAFPFLYAYLYWQNSKKEGLPENRPVLAILKQVAEIESELSDVRREVEKRKKTEAALLKSEAMLNATNRMARVGGWEFDTDTQAVFWTDETYRIHEVQPSRLLSLDQCLDFFHPEDREQLSHSIWQAIENGTSYDMELRLFTTSGNLLWVRSIGWPLDREGKIVKLTGTIQDITDRKETELALKEYRDDLKDQVEKRTRQLSKAKIEWENTFDAISDWISILDENQKIIRTNKASMDLFGLHPKEIIGKHCYHLIHKTECPIDDCPGIRVLNSRQRESMELQFDEERWVLVTVDPIIGPNDQVERIVHVVRDITDVKKREQQIVAARKSEAFSILSGGIAHDYNNLLAVIWGNISLIKEYIKDAEAEDFFNEAEHACEQARNLTHQFITLSRGAIVTKSPINIRDLLVAAIESSETADRIDCSIKITDRLPLVELDSELMRIAIANIIINAAEAMPDGGKLEIRAETEPPIDDADDLPGNLNLIFADQGRGIATADLSKVFDPYYTTKERGKYKGMGLGLAVSQSVVLKHDGRIEIMSQPGRGTTVKIVIPLKGLDQALTDIADDATGRPPVRPTVLLLEDNASLRKLCSHMLIRLGCDVIAASNGAEAIKEFGDAMKNYITIDLILMDQNIRKGLGGVETLSKLRQLGCDEPAVLVTGSPNHPAITDFKKYGFDGKLIKPYTKKEIEAIIRQFIAL